ncbi:MAG: FGGY family carbohydrate kinase [Chloroflexota bacterium]|nr:FGGY family carbohydrate kinase [Chloroflexota bacterium]MDE2884158.1 FGGY family carbohydrate kinase [Chloroflexota bacterium]
MIARVILVLDLGSSRLRCATVPLGDGGAPLEVARAPYPVRNDRAGALAHAYNPHLLRTRLLRTLAQGAQAAGPGNVAAVAVTAQRLATCFFDARLRTLSAGANNDTRAVFQGGVMDDAHGPLIHRTTGHLPAMLFAPSKYAWWRENRPHKARRIAKTAGLDAWAALQLTETLAETRLGLAESGLLDVTSGKPAGALLERLGLPLNLLADTLPPDAPVGQLTAEAAEATRLPRATPVHLAGPDSHAATVGCGAASDGAAACSAGWSAPVHVTTRSPAFDSAARTWTSLHGVNGKWTVEATPGETGRMVDFVRRVLAPRASHERFDALAQLAFDSGRPVTALLGPRAIDLSNPAITMGGVLMPAPVTQEGLDAADVARAAFENAAFAIRESLSLARSVAGAEPGAFALSGGMAESAVFPQLLADVLGEPVRIHHNATAAGAAALASTPASELKGRCADLAANGVSVEPGPRSGECRESYERWLRLRERLDALTEEL